MQHARAKKERRQRSSVDRAGSANQRVCDALKRLSSEAAVWVTLRGRRYKLAPFDASVFGGGAVLLAVKTGYEVVELFKRKGPHQGLDRWQVHGRQRRAFWTSTNRVRALVVEGYPRKPA